jgi:hypothetical protein
MKSEFALAECLSQIDEELLPKEAAENLYGKEEGLVSKGNPTGTVFADPSTGYHTVNVGVNTSTLTIP